MSRFSAKKGSRSTGIIYATSSLHAHVKTHQSLIRSTILPPELIFHAGRLCNSEEEIKAKWKPAILKLPAIIVFSVFPTPLYKYIISGM